MTSVDERITDQPNARADEFRWRFSLRSLLIALTLISLLSAWVATTLRLRTAEAELSVLRRQTGYLDPSGTGQIAAVRVPSDEPLTYRLRVRVPASSKYRVAYSTQWQQGNSSPSWYSAIDLPPGESQLIVQIQADPRDDRWKITTIIRSDRGTKRIATVLPDDHVRAFRGSYDAMSSGIGWQTEFARQDKSIRLLDERWLVGEGGLLLYGNKEPKDDIIGVFAELQPDTGPL